MLDRMRDDLLSIQDALEDAMVCLVSVHGEYVQEGHIFGATRLVNFERTIAKIKAVLNAR
jgi:hypothetical protein